MQSQQVKVNFVAKSLFWTMSRVLCVTQTVPVVPCYLSVNVGNQLDYMGSSLSPLFTGKEKRSYCVQDVFLGKLDSFHSDFV